MPTIIVFCRDVYTLEQRRNFVREVTRATCETLNNQPEQVTIRLIRSPDEDISRGGVLRIDQPSAGQRQ